LLQSGALIGGKYRLEKLLGHGAMGMVWAARNERTDRAFAIKFMLPQFARDPTLVQRFFREAKVCGRLEHPSLVHIYDLGMAEEAGSVPYMVMELLRGEGLDVVLKRAGRLDPRPAVSMMVGVSAALALAHKAGVVHRDIKPANIFLHRSSQNGEVSAKILDFGISKSIGVGPRAPSLTHVGMLVGTPLYMSPEQARGQRDIDARSDLWGMGVILYQAIAGVAPFNENNYNAVLTAILTHRHKALSTVIPGLPPVLSETIDLCLAKDRNRRLASADLLTERLEQVMLDFERMDEANEGGGDGVPNLDLLPVPKLEEDDDEENEETEIMSFENMPAEVIAASMGGGSQRNKRKKAAAGANARGPRKNANWAADFAAMVHTDATDDVAESSRLATPDADENAAPQVVSPSTVPPPMAETVDLPPATRPINASNPGPGPGPTYMMSAGGPATNDPTVPLMSEGNILGGPGGGVHLSQPGPPPPPIPPISPVRPAPLPYPPPQPQHYISHEPSHVGMGANMGPGMGAGMGNMGPGMGAGMGPNMGPGMGAGMGAGADTGPRPVIDLSPGPGRPVSSPNSTVRWVLMILLLIIGMGVGAIVVLWWGSKW
jgi:eukaryotic-like serine/threonine-protein kinase